jgi:glycosyltransferase involved in cell wall biosynthesis
MPVEPTVVFVAPRGTAGGPNQSLLSLLPALAGVHRVLAAPRGLVSYAGVADEYLSLAESAIPDRPTRALAALRLAGWVTRRRRSIVALHANGVSGLNLCGPAALLNRLPVVVWAHASRLSDTSARLGRFWAHRLPIIRWAAVSSASRQLLIDGGFAAPDQIVIVPNPVDGQKIATRRPTDRVTVSYLGGHATFKGYHLLPGVIELLYETGVRWQVVAGAGANATGETDPITSSLQALAGPNLNLSGWIGDVRDVYAETDIVFCPSFRESFGRVAAEAMANGIPVVASRLPAFEELIGEGEAGLLFPPGDAAAAAEAIRRLAQDPGLRHRMGEEGQRRSAMFSPELVAARFRVLYGMAD